LNFILKILIAFSVHSEYRAHSCDSQEYFVHAQNCRGAFDVEKYRTANLKVYSNCTLTAF